MASRAQLEADEAKSAAQVNRHEEEQRRGSGGPQFTWNHGTEALLCSDHRHRTRELELLEVPMEEALNRLRADAGMPTLPKLSSHDPHRQPATSTWWDRCLQWWRGGYRR